MPKPRMTKAQAQKISKGCMLRFFSVLEGCLGEQILTPEQCLRDAASQWDACMRANGITIKARSRGRGKPRPRGAAMRARRRSTLGVRARKSAHKANTATEARKAWDAGKGFGHRPEPNHAN